jgi:hypothetical protein
MNETRQKITPPQLARQWGVSPDKIIGWILAGELAAIDASAKQGGRPRYLIDLDDIVAFERKRAAGPTAKPAPRRRPPIKQYV